MFRVIFTPEHFLVIMSGFNKKIGSKTLRAVFFAKELQPFF